MGWKNKGREWQLKKDNRKIRDCEQSLERDKGKESDREVKKGKVNSIQKEALSVEDFA